MSNHKYNQNVLIGAAVAAGILGTLTSLLGFKKNGKRLSEQAKEMAHQVLDTGDVVNKKMVLGGITGGLVGAAAALLLAPKSGSDLIKDMARPFSQEIAHARSSVTKHKKKSHAALAKTKTKIVNKVAKKKSDLASKAKKITKRARTASAALSKGAADREKNVSEVKES